MTTIRKSIPPPTDHERARSALPWLAGFDSWLARMERTFGASGTDEFGVRHTLEYLDEIKPRLAAILEKRNGN